jgi:hypothetical protein
LRHPPLSELKSVFSEFPGIQAVYLFGSHACGRARRDSDLDLAILTDDSILRNRKLDILACLAEKGFCNVDLVFPPENDIVLQYEAVRLNRIVYRRDDFDSGSTFSLIVRRYLDFIPYLKVQREAYKKRLLDGSA